MLTFKSKENKRLNLTKSDEYLEVKIDLNLGSQDHVNYLSIKLNRANGLLFKIKKDVGLIYQLRSINFAIFESCLILDSKFQHYSKDRNFTKKSVRIIDFQPRNSQTSPLLKQSSILKSQDKICLKNILFLIKSLNNLSPSVLLHGLVFLQST